MYKLIWKGLRALAARRHNCHWTLFCTMIFVSWDVLLQTTISKLKQVSIATDVHCSHKQCKSKNIIQSNLSCILHPGPPSFPRKRGRRSRHRCGACHYGDFQAEKNGKVEYLTCFLCPCSRRISKWGAVALFPKALLEINVMRCPTHLPGAPSFASFGTCRRGE